MHVKDADVRGGRLDRRSAATDAQHPSCRMLITGSDPTPLISELLQPKPAGSAAPICWA